MKRDQGLRFMLQKQVVLCLIAIFIIGIGYIRVKPVAAEVATSTIEYVSAVVPHLLLAQKIYQ